MEKKYKYHTILTLEKEKGEEGAFEKIQRFYAEKTFRMAEIHPFGKIKNLIAYSLKGDGYEIALDVRKYQNEKKVLKEDIGFQGTDYERDSDLINKVLEKLDK